MHRILYLLHQAASAHLLLSELVYYSINFRNSTSSLNLCIIPHWHNNVHLKKAEDDLKLKGEPVIELYLHEWHAYVLGENYFVLYHITGVWLLHNYSHSHQATWKCGSLNTNKKNRWKQVQISLHVNQHL